MISLVQLEYIVAVDTFRNFAKASENCFVTQPTLSMQIKKMEDEWGVKIFDRSIVPVVPTEIGERIIQQAKMVLSEAGLLDNLVKEFLKDYSGTFSIGIIPTLAPYLLPLFAGHFKEKYPLVNLKIEELITEKIVNELKNDQLDAGIFVTPYNDREIIELPVFYEELLVYAHKNHPLLKKKNITVKDIATDDIWLLNDGHCFRSQVINLCAIDKNHKHNLPFELEGGSLETLMRIINRDGGFTIIPELAAIDLIAFKSKNIAFFSGKKPEREVSVCYSNRFTKRRLIDVLVQEIKDSIPPEMLSSERGEVVAWK